MQPTAPAGSTGATADAGSFGELEDPEGSEDTINAGGRRWARAERAVSNSEARWSRS